MSDIIFWIVFGGIAGSIAKFLMPGKTEPSGCLMTIILGIVGSVLGGWIGKTLWGSEGITGWNWGSYISAIVGTIVVLYIYGKITGKK
ncbi:MAG TPA: GlsB/YeaQ/YmgE family stress response membrane protein [Edaphocola sp.]|nr:GlsB/YeaQ/YmgE family stress response membrane protein [Edaphocola sp.]